MKGHRTSGLLFIFWVLLVFFAIPQLRNEIQQYESESIQSWHQFQFINYLTYFSFITVMLLLNCFADVAPRKTTFTKTSNPSPELRSSFLRQVFFQWFDSTTWVGWRRPLTEKDIYDINPEDTSRELVPPFDKHFNESVEKGRRCALTGGINISFDLFPPTSQQASDGWQEAEGRRWDTPDDEDD